MSKKVAVIMGPDSDLDTVRPCIQRFRSFSVSTEVHVISAHHIPAAAERFASQARENGFGAVIAAAGKTAHLAGVLATYTTLPVVDAPIKTSIMSGLNAFLSMVQVPKRIPVACVAVNGADNAATLFAQIPALSDEALNDRLVQFKAGAAAKVEVKDHRIQVEEFQYVLREAGTAL